MQRQHHYKAIIQWTGNKGTGTDNYRNYERSHQIIIESKSDISGSSDGKIESRRKSQKIRRYSIDRNCDKHWFKPHTLSHHSQNRSFYTASLQ